jgi:aminopeptidase 2
MNDAMALAKAGLAKLTSALTLMDGFARETDCTYCATSIYPSTEHSIADIVLSGIAANISGLLDAWWEHPTILEQLQSLERVCYSTLAGFVLTDAGSIQHIFVPLVAELGYEYHSGESTDTAAIRTLAVKRAADARDPRCDGHLNHEG